MIYLVTYLYAPPSAVAMNWIEYRKDSNVQKTVETRKYEARAQSHDYIIIPPSHFAACFAAQIFFIAPDERRLVLSWKDNYNTTIQDSITLLLSYILLCRLRCCPEVGLTLNRSACAASVHVAIRLPCAQQRWGKFSWHPQSSQTDGR
jgi:hypothetical protein